jgi:hypothetical protein
VIDVTDLLEQRARPRFVGNVERGGSRSGRQLRQRSLQLLLRTPGDHHLRTFGRSGLGGGEAHPGAATKHGHYF